MAKRPIPTQSTRAGGTSSVRKSQSSGPNTRTSGTNEKSKPLAQNRKARHDYEILETFECGIVLMGSEIKSIRAGQVQLREAYVRIENSEAWLVGAHISPYKYATSSFGAHDPNRSRKLLLHRREIDQLSGKAAQKSLTIVPLSIYLRNGRAKVEIALGKGRALYDKRREIARKDAEREMQRAASMKKTF